MQPLISFVIPCYNSAPWIKDVLRAVAAQDYPKNRTEIIIIDDNSADDTVKIAKSCKPWFKKHKRFVVHVKSKKLKRSGAVSFNVGMKMANGEFLCAVDSDAVIDKGWATSMIKPFKDPRLGIAAGYIRTANPENYWASVAGFELEDRYDRIKSKYIDHVSTCDTVYRASVMKQMKYFDEKIYYYGFEVDLSYRVRNAGYKILLNQKVGCDHYWKSSFTSYIKQQYNVAFGRMSIVTSHPTREVGDRVTGAFLFWMLPLTWLALLGTLVFPKVGVWLLIVLIITLSPQSWRVVKKSGKPSLILFPLILILRNVTWSIAMVMFMLKNIPTMLRFVKLKVMSYV